MKFSSKMFYGESTWERTLASFKGRENVSYLEVGVYEGYSLVWMFNNILTHPSCQAVAIDLFTNPQQKDTFIENCKELGVDHRVQVIEGLSRFALRELKPESFDIIYLDGSHASKDVLIDAILSWDLLKVGGIMIFDDYDSSRKDTPEEVFPQISVDHFCRQFRDELKVLVYGYQVIVQKMTTSKGESLVLGNRIVFNLGKIMPGVEQGGDLEFHDRATSELVPATMEQKRIVFGIIARLRREADFETLPLSDIEIKTLQELGWERFYNFKYEAKLLGLA